MQILLLGVSQKHRLPEPAEQEPDLWMTQEVAPAQVSFVADSTLGCH